MGRAPCCDKARVKRGAWSPEEDATLKSYIERHGTGGNWIALPKKAVWSLLLTWHGLNRCGKSCRLRWLNYLRPDIKRGAFTVEEDGIISTLYNKIGSRWSMIAGQLPGRTDNEIKNYWNTKLKKQLLADNTNSLASTVAPLPQLPSDAMAIKAEPSSICLSPPPQDVSAASLSVSMDDGGSDIFRVLDLGVSSDWFLSWCNLVEGSAVAGTK